MEGRELFAGGTSYLSYIDASIFYAKLLIALSRRVVPTVLLCSVPLIGLLLLSVEAALKLWLLLLLLGSAHQVIEGVHSGGSRLIGLHAHLHLLHLHLLVDLAHHLLAHHGSHRVHSTGHGLESASHGLEAALSWLLLLGGLLLLLAHQCAERVLSRQVLLGREWVSLSSGLLSRLRVLLLCVELIQLIQVIVSLELSGWLGWRIRC